MKIINKQEFLKMPAGTVFMKFGPGTLPEGESRGAFGDICIKAERIGPDFRFLSLDPSLNCVGRDDAIDMLDADPSLDVPIEIQHTCKDDDVPALDQKFAVWSKCDVEELIRVFVAASVGVGANRD